MSQNIDSIKKTCSKKHHKGCILWTTGLSGSGKTTLTKKLAETLKECGFKVELLDGDVIREHLSKGLGFSQADRDTNIYRIAFVADLLARNGVIVLTAAISPYEYSRGEIKTGYKNLFEVYVNAPLDECIRRDVKGLYKKAIAGEIKHFTGISDPYEAPTNPDLEINTDRESLEQSERKVLDFLIEKGIIPQCC